MRSDTPPGRCGDFRGGSVLPNQHDDVGQLIVTSNTELISTVTSKDGTTIGYSTFGRGPGLVLVHGAGQSAKTLSRLATALADSFTVSLIDRRGRGMTPSYGTFRGLESEIEDLSAVLDATGATFAFGLSAGAVIVLETATVRPGLSKIALYEPPLSFDGVAHGVWVSRYDDLLAAGKPGSALVTVMKATADRTSKIRWIPAPLLGPVLNFIIKRAARQPSPPGALSPRELIPTLHNDAKTVLDATGPLERFADLQCETLLLGGETSARDLSASLRALNKVLLHSRFVELSGLGHTAADNSRQPLRVAEELRAFFGMEGSQRSG